MKKIQLNKKVLAILCLVVFLVGAVAMPAFALPDQALPAFDRKVVERIDVNNIWTHLEVLTEEIGPRVMGTSEERAAAEYIADVFESYGYEVSFFESPIRYLRPDTFIVPEVSIKAPVQSKLFPAPLTNTALATGDGITGEVVDWGDSLEAPPDANGRIALMDSPDGANRFYEYDDEVDAAIEAGATAVIFIMYDFGPDSWANRLGGRLSDPIDVPAAIISPMQGEELRDLMSEEDVTINIQLERENQTTQHVIATRTPDNKNRAKDEVFIIGAHYDSVYGAPGANDNASSVATMLELARTYANYPIDKELRFMAFGAEEGGQGSSHYVSTLSEEEINRISGMFNMEMLGSTWEPVDTVYVATLDGSTNFMTDAVVAAGGRFVQDIPTDLAVGGSDHVPFHRAGIEAVCYARAFPGATPWDPEGRFGLEPAYHTPYDNLEQMCKERLDEAAKIAGAATYDILRPDTPNLEQSKIRNTEKVLGPTSVVPSR